MPDSVADGQPYVFISYASADHERVLTIVDVLREAGITCWLDQHDIAGGANWGGSIADAIEGCTAFVLMSSASSLASRNVRQEVALAWQHDKPYVPLHLDSTPIPNDVAYWLATAQWIEILDHSADTWLPKIEQALSRLCKHPPTVAVPPVPDSVKTAQPTVSLPSPPSSFVGREREVAEIAALLHTERIVTLVGPGGIGKTRVAIAVGHRLTEEYADGVVFVDLAPLRDPVLVLPTIAAALGIRESGDVPLVDALVTALRQRRLLLILDNVEQVIEAAGDISRLVSASPSLAILATSRELLRIGGEAEYPLAPLPLPQTEPDVIIERLRSNPTIALFVQRVRSSKPGFDLTPENAADIVAICQRLDGLPLAIELAAAQIRILPPRALTERLLQPIGVLTGGARDLPQRQRTMRDAIRWSYDLLSPDEQRLFRRLSIFIGGWTFESAEAVVNAEGDLGIDLFDGLASLADKSLILHHDLADGTTRFAMLGMIREYAAEQLARTNEAEPVYRRLAHTVEQLAASLRRTNGTVDEGAMVVRIDRERDNLRAALDWCLRVGQSSDHWSAVGVRITTDCWVYWDTTGQWPEGRRWIEALLAVGDHLPVELRIDALSFAGEAAEDHGDYAAADEHLTSAIKLAEQIARPDLSANALTMRARRLLQLRQFDAAETLARQILGYRRAQGDASGIGQAMYVLFAIAGTRGDMEQARVQATETIAFQRQQGNLSGLAISMTEYGWLVFWMDDVTQATALATDAITLSHQQRYVMAEGWATMLWSLTALRAGNPDRARHAAIKGLLLLQRAGNRPGVVRALVHAALIAHEVGLVPLAARLVAADYAVGASSFFIHPRERDERQRIATAVRAALGDAEYERLQHEAQTLTLDDAVAAVIAAFTSGSIIEGKQH